MSATQRETALVTGASSGIGADIARELAGRGYDLVLTARRTDRLEALKAELTAARADLRVDVVPADLGASGGVAGLIEKVEALGVPISFLVNNAGFGVHGDFFDHDPTRLRAMLDLNIGALTELSWHFGRSMRTRKRGRILQVASMAAYQPSPYYAAYAATKAYVLFLSEALNFELRGSGVTVTTLNPGLTATEFHEVAEHPKTGLVAMTVMSPRSVARIGVGTALRGKAVVTAGLINKLSGLLAALLPRSWVNAMAGMMMR
jgi:short-subunit dehydrogenase